MKITIQKEWNPYARKWQYFAYKKIVFGILYEFIAGSNADTEEDCIAKAKLAVNHATIYKEIDV